MRDQRNALQETATQLFEHRLQRIEDLDIQRIECTTELDRSTAVATATNAVLSERARTLQEQVAQVERQREVAITHCRAEHKSRWNVCTIT